VDVDIENDDGANAHDVLAAVKNADIIIATREVLVVGVMVLRLCCLINAIDMSLHNTCMGISGRL